MGHEEQPLPQSGQYRPAYAIVFCYNTLMSNQASIREEELKNSVAMLHLGKYDCTRIVGNFTSGDSPALATPIDRNNFTYIYRDLKGSAYREVQGGVCRVRMRQGQGY